MSWNSKLIPKPPPFSPLFFGNRYQVSSNAQVKITPGVSGTVPFFIITFLSETESTTASLDLQFSTVIFSLLAKPLSQPLHVASSHLYTLPRGSVFSLIPHYTFENGD